MSKDESKAKGGHARAKALSGKRKREIATKGAAARWLRATHKGSFKEEFGIDVDCYVLDDEQKTAVISQRGMAEALGLSRGGGSRLPRFIGSRSIAPHVGPELQKKFAKPLVFQGLAAGPNLPTPGTVYGYDVTMLIDLCRAIIEADAEGTLIDRYQNVVRQAHIIIAASAKAGIKGLVYALAGYSPAVEEIIAAFKAFVRQEAREYEKEFPTLLYKEWQRLYAIQGPISRNWKGMHLTINHVYHPLARSEGRVLELMRGARNTTQELRPAERRKKLHQFLSEVGVKALRTHLGQVLGVARISKTKEQYEASIKMLFGEPDHQLELKYESNEP